MSFSGVMNVHEHCFRKKMVFDFKQIVVIHVCVCIVDEILSTLIIALYILEIHVYKGMWEMRLDHSNILNIHHKTPVLSYTQ